MDAAEDDVLAYMTFHPDDWTRISSTNPLERLIGEIKRRADVVGIFPNEPAIVRLVGALQLEQNDGWAVGRPISASRPSPPSGVLTSSSCPLLHTPRT